MTHALLTIVAFRKNSTAPNTVLATAISIQGRKQSISKLDFS